MSAAVVQRMSRRTKQDVVNRNPNAGLPTNILCLRRGIGECRIIGHLDM